MISPIQNFAYQVGLNVYYLENLINRCDYYYKEHFIKKKNGSDRKISSPNYQVKAIQSWILRNVLDKVPISAKAHGFVRDKGIRTNALVHCGKQYILCVDIHEFFPSIKILDIEKVFMRILNQADLAKLFAKICCYKGRLPQGGVTSPCLSNIFFNPIDNEIEDLCGSNDVRYTRYADDLTFSSNDKQALQIIRENLPLILKKCALTLNAKKTRIYSGNGPKLVTGLYLNSGKPTIGRSQKRRLRAMLHHRLVLNDKNVNEMKLLGYLSFLKDIERDYYKKLKSYIGGLKMKKVSERPRLSA